jgi:uncharacterized protein (TIGR02246 family)
MNSVQKVAIITGASQGIGAELVTAYRKLGYGVVANSRSIDESDDPDVLAVAGDVAQPGVGARIVEAALARFGRIDTLINNAGVFVAKPFTEYTDEDFDTVTGVNLRGFFEVSRGAVAAMLDGGRGGHVVNVSTSLVDHANSEVPSAMASLTKGGLNAVTKSRGNRIRRSRHPGQHRRTWHHRHPDAPGVDPRRPRGNASAWPNRRGQGRRRRRGLPGERAVRHRRDPARRRRPERGALIMQHETVLRGVLDQWKAGVDAHDPQRVASLFAEDAIFQGLRPYSVGRQGVADYYAGQPAGLSAEYRILETRQLTDDVVLGYLDVDFSFVDRPAVNVHLGVLVKRIDGDWLIVHYQVS